MNIEALKQNQEFIQKLSKAADAKEITALFAAQGITVREEDAQLALQKIEAGDTAELDASALDQVSGGGIGLGMAVIGLIAVVGFARGIRCK